ncbi:cyclic nucleotide-binding domain-containing protein [Rummeliibacillus sp. G93]|uniref:Crp/Fnr family transcriptional regulator n=1 Tax=Rummeliibacillus TaxID=648802 RepID=UPI0011674AFF|nr:MULTISPECIES: cyclic nucleotide-binding domain-containing protein [Rummeliibacillus]MBB5171783.1 CRP-like cAMP-binding protein [Rummeliibacillus stabekisii]UQW97540.1 cyclic nucleotide-binding domain-containing protein [Rummeliibacillus sp. G93]GEL06468.1 catabolite gene activator protein [Rummeliibacillus stabekisii]
MKVIHDSCKLHEKIHQYKLQEIFPTFSSKPFALYHYAAGEVLLHEGEEMTMLLYLVEGKIKTTSSVGTGKSLLLRFSQPLSIIGDLELVRHVPVQSQITSVTECLCIALPFDYINQHEKNNPLFLQHLIKHLSYKLQTCTTAARVNLLASVENRFASYLLSITTPDNEFGVELQTQNIGEIADLLGTTRRHLDRVIHKLSEQGIIERGNKFFRILSHDALEDLSQGIRYE